jgi:hypothetical protein
MPVIVDHGFPWWGTAPRLYHCSDGTIAQTDGQMSLLHRGPIALREEAPVRGAGASSGAAFFWEPHPVFWEPHPVFWEPHPVLFR